jgi:glycosyltransferase involved in cell wall biosynthesis
MVYMDVLLLLKSLKRAFSEDVDIIHGHLHEGAFIGKLCAKFKRAAVVFDAQGSLTGEMVAHGFLKSHGSWYKIMKYFERTIDNMADGVVASSASLARMLREEFGVEAEKIVTVPDGVDTDLFKPMRPDEMLKRKLGIPPDRKIIVYLGGLGKYKGIDLLLESISYIHDIPEYRKSMHFLIMGYPGASEYRALAKKLGIADKTTFTGRINYLDAPRYLGLGDIAVAPKILRSGEANGKIYNYMGCGLPVVAFDYTTNREILGDLGVYARREDPVALAEGILKLVDDESLRNRLSKSLREKAVSSCRWDRAGAKLMELYRTLNI